ncbi:hypothetical protein H9L39_11749 [Fusarium oxysporum f. sp. albedinis]|nr:hypothetical protein H9L39_11749 [Fusarium oxysporum f. sp. albedinis]
MIRVPPVSAVDAWGLNTIDIDHGLTIHIVPMGHGTPRISQLNSGCSRMTPALSLLVKDEDGCILLRHKVMPSTRNGELFPPVRVSRPSHIHVDDILKDGQYVRCRRHPRLATANNFSLPIYRSERSDHWLGREAP